LYVYCSIQGTIVHNSACEVYVYCSVQRTLGHSNASSLYLSNKQTFKRTGNIHHANVRDCVLPIIGRERNIYLYTYVDGERKACVCVCVCVCVVVVVVVCVCINIHRDVRDWA
jgi:hypothetical protein